MNYEQSNVGPGMVPCKTGCNCNECTIERLTAELADCKESDRLIERLQARVGALENLLRDVMNDCNLDTYDDIARELAAGERR